MATARHIRTGQRHVGMLAAEVGISDTHAMRLLDRLAAIRTRNLARYSPESRAEFAEALGSYNWRWRGWSIAALIVVAVAQTTPTAVRITGDGLGFAAFAVSAIYLRKHLREMKKAQAALRASRIAYDAEHPRQEADSGDPPSSSGVL